MKCLRKEENIILTSTHWSLLCPIPGSSPFKSRIVSTRALAPLKLSSIIIFDWLSLSTFPSLSCSKSGVPSNFCSTTKLSIFKSQPSSLKNLQPTFSQTKMVSKIIDKSYSKKKYNLKISYLKSCNIYVKILKNLIWRIRLWYKGWHKKWNNWLNSTRL